jgi:serine/threonine protein kinase
VKHKRTDAAYAMKILQKSQVTRGNLLRYTVTERNILSYIRHPYIVSLHYAFQTPQHLVLVLQYCSGGDLQSKIRMEKRLDHSRSSLYSAEVLTALAHLHERLIVYRDLKPENVVMDGEGHCLLTDFGLSKEGVADLTKSFCGSLAFLAPEVLQHRGHDHTVDIYGLGVLLFAMLTGGPPFFDRKREKLILNIQAASLHIPHYVSPAASALIEALMKREPKRRLGASRTMDIQSHVFYKSLDFDALLRREVEIPSPSTSPASRRPQATPAGDVVLDDPFKNAREGGGFWRGLCALNHLIGQNTPDRGTTLDKSSEIGNWNFAGIHQERHTVEEEEGLGG